MNIEKGVPEGFHSVTPSLIVRDAAQAIDFYKRVFGAEEKFRMNAPDGRVAHAEVKIGDSIVFLSDEFPEMGGNCQSPQALGGTTGGLSLYVPDVDTVFERALKAGAAQVMPVADMFWGDRYGSVTDPFGHRWAIATRKENLTAKQVEERARDFYAKMAQQMQKKTA
jgi:PhnB protein